MKKEVLKEEVDQILAQSFWGKSGVKLTEDTQVTEDTPAEEAVEASDDQVESVNEETHSCPLCESELESPISDEKLTEHIEMMLGIINEMNDITDEELESIEEEMDQLEETDESDDSDEESEIVESKKKVSGSGEKPKKPKMKVPTGLKSAMSGKGPGATKPTGGARMKSNAR